MTDDFTRSQSFDVPDGFELLPWHRGFGRQVGPLFEKRDADGLTRGFRVEDHHTNGMQNAHGGMLMTFADYSLFAIASDILEGPAVTVSFSAEFTAAAGAGEFVEARGEIVQNTGSMVFLRGQVFTGAGEKERILLNFSGIVKRVKKRPLSD